MSTEDRVRDLVSPIVASHDAELYDVQFNRGTLVVAVERDGGLDLDRIGAITREVSRALDESDPVAGSYTLEVTSPGLERTLRTEAHYAKAIGSTVTIKTRPGVEGDRRLAGTLTSVRGDTVTVALDEGGERTLRLDEIERARTTFEWGAAPKPSDRPSGRSGRKKAARS